jgi:hypothetical protein
MLVPIISMAELPRSTGRAFFFLIIGTSTVTRIHSSFTRPSAMHAYASRCVGV